MRWGHVLFGGTALAAPYFDRLLDSVPVTPDSADVHYGARVAIYANTSRGRVYGHGGPIPDYVSSLRRYADHGTTVAYQINTDLGFLDGASDLAPLVEAALADLAIKAML